MYQDFQLISKFSKFPLKLHYTYNSILQMADGNDGW